VSRRVQIFIALMLTIGLVISSIIIFGEIVIAMLAGLVAIGGFSFICWMLATVIDENYNKSTR
jgi:hypothetical protein